MHKDIAVGGACPARHDAVSLTDPRDIRKEGPMAETYTNLPAPSPEQGLNRYLQEIRKFPMLEPQE